eukprot:1156603-Pelagomonas_calceolata.AAC.5
MWAGGGLGALRQVSGSLWRHRGCSGMLGPRLLWAGTVHGELQLLLFNGFGWGRAGAGSMKTVGTQALQWHAWAQAAVGLDVAW